MEKYGTYAVASLCILALVAAYKMGVEGSSVALLGGITTIITWLTRSPQSDILQKKDGDK